MPDPRTHTVRISLRNTGIKPPVYLASSFTDPPWHPVELKHRPRSQEKDTELSSELEFYGIYNVPEGNHHYKFRLGDGDWWVCNDSSETILDGAGNRNNLLRVTSQSSFNHNSAASSIPERKHAHAKAHFSLNDSDPNPVWDLIGIDPIEAANGQKTLSPWVHEVNCPLREHYDHNHPAHLAMAADACQCARSSVNITFGKDGEERSQSKSETDNGRVRKGEKSRLSAIRVPTSSVREYQFFPVPENTPLFPKTEAILPRLQSEGVLQNPSDSQRSQITQDIKADDLAVVRHIQSQSKKLAPTQEEEEDLLDTREATNVDDETPRRRQLSDAEIQSVRQSMTHLGVKSNQDLVNSAESDQAMPHERDGHGEVPLFPHEALTPTNPQSTYTPHSYTKMTPKLFPQALSRIPTISMLNDPILAAFPTGDDGLLNHKVAVTNSKEKLEDDLMKEWTDGEDLVSDEEEEEEEQLNAIVHSPTFKHEVPLDYQQIRRQSIHRFSPPTDGASDPPPSSRILRTPTRESVVAGQTHSNHPRYGSLHGSFADVKRIDSLGQEIEDDENSPLLHRKVSQDPLTVDRRSRKVSNASFETALSRSSSYCGLSDGTHAPKNATVTFWHRMWQILTGWVASWWAACMGKEVHDSVTDDESSQGAIKKRK